MCFRPRLLLFFTIIVIVPMGAVALVLFSITSQSELGKADARIAEGMRVALAVYRQERSDAVPALRRGGGGPPAPPPPEARGGRAGPQGPARPAGTALAARARSTHV